MDKKNTKDHLSMLFRITEFKEANCLNALLKKIMFWPKKRVQFSFVKFVKVLIFYTAVMYSI